MKAKLIVIGGDAKATEVTLKLPALVGRGREANLKLSHSLVSRKHCEIYESQGSLFVRDLGSLNGTFINSKRIENPTILPTGELLTIGTVTFRAVYEAGDQTCSESKSAEHSLEIVPENSSGDSELSTTPLTQSTQEIDIPGQFNHIAEAEEALDFIEDELAKDLADLDDKNEDEIETEESPPQQEKHLDSVQPSQAPPSGNQ